MRTNTTKQAGFSMVIGIIAAVLVIAVVGYGGWRVCHFNKPASTTTSSTQTSNASTQPTATYLDIKELGIKIKLSDSVKDAVYSYNPPDSSSPSTSSAIINTDSLAAASKGTCSASTGGALGTIIKTSDQNVEGYPLIPDGKTIFKLGNYYYQLKGPDAICSTDPAVNALANQQKNTFSTDFKTIQLDN